MIVALSITLAGCMDDALYSGLSESEANDMVALLFNSGISAKKIRSNDQRYSVVTTTENFAKAIDILKNNGFPKNSFDSLGEVFKKEGFVSSPLEERARLNYAQSQELARTIESIDGVLLARVHLAIPEENQLESTKKPSSASVFIKHRRGVDLSDRESQIKALIVNSIEGLPYENVTVAMFTANPVPVSVINKQESGKYLNISLTMYEYLIFACAALILFLSALVIFLWLRSNRSEARLRLLGTQQR
ncbi:MAG: type III secretion system inner membrane ring lipoprotein SctJ [Candidatus Thiodiazotropha sp.]